jgi:uncharacterized protein with NAD-binding domain and iron-sulfur cluster
MTKNFFRLFFLFLLLTACSRPLTESNNVVSEVIDRRIVAQPIQVSQAQLLPPYGVYVQAETAVLTLHLSSSQNNATNRTVAIQESLDEITTQANNSESIRLQAIDIDQVSESYSRAEEPTSRTYTLDTSSVTVELSYDLVQNEPDLRAAIVAFEDFLNQLMLPDTVTIEAVSVKAQLGDLEEQRAQIIAQLYQELDAVQGDYGDEVLFEISGLYDGLKQIQISGVTFYIYLEPVVTVREF